MEFFRRDIIGCYYTMSYRGIIRPEQSLVRLCVS